MRIILITYILFSLQLLVAQENNPFLSRESVDPEATEVLSSIHDKLTKNGTVVYDFSFEIQYPDETPQIILGSLIQKNERFHLSMNDREIYTDSKSMWVYDKDMNVVEIYDADFGEEGAFMSPTEFLRLYNSPDYTYILEDKWYEGDDEISRILFKPLKDDSEYFKMTMEIANKDPYLKEMKIFAKDGSRYMLNFTNIAFSNEYNDDYFVFNTTDYKDIQIENLRID